jgi:UDP-N-acetylglucosamine--N-acetylmuramyl-(pentapeptide) pyrophosphoryl-undecaprenol N-acetylglucosamine transferase
MGGSQGASGINRLVIGALPQLAAELPELQFIHLTGSRDFEEVRAAYARVNRPAVVHTFLGPVEQALGAASVAVSRAGASSLAELAAVRLPAILVPYPTAADNHQFHNARAFVETGAARLLDQRYASPWALAALINELVRNSATAEAMKVFLARWHRPDAAERIAGDLLSRLQSHPAGQPAAVARPPRARRELLKAKS